MTSPTDDTNGRPGADEGKPSGRPPRRRRRRRQGGKGRGDGARESSARDNTAGDGRGSEDQGRGGQRRGGQGRDERRRDGKGRPRRGRGRPRKEEPAVASEQLEESRIDAERPADEPLTEAEVAEMRVHLRFLRRHRRDLKLKLNATEDLLVNGSREPTHRGQCLHLLNKVDLSTVTSALSKMTDGQAKIQLLAGVVRFSSDAGVLLLYLEALREASSRREAAAAFGSAVKRIDFASLSEARMRRVLDLIASTFDGHDRVQVLFGLLQSATFREAFDASESALPDELSELFVPLRSVHEVVFAGRRDTHGAGVLRQGVTVLLSAPRQVLQSYPRPVRERLLESAVRLVEDARVADEAEDALLASLPPEDRAFSRLGLLRAAELLSRHEDDRARRVLEKIRNHHEDFELPSRWLTALDAPRLGRLALLPDQPRGRDGRSRSRTRPETALRWGFWLDRQVPTWIRTGDPEDAPRTWEETQLQRRLTVPGVAPVLTDGVADGTPHVAMPGTGRPVTPMGGLRRRSLPRKTLGIAAEGVRILHLLALLGIELPDAAPGRFLVDDGSSPALVWLADLGGVREAESAAETHRRLATEWCQAVLGESAIEALPSETAALVADVPDLGELARGLAALA